MKLFNDLTKLLCLGLLLFAVSCDSTDDLLIDDEDDTEFSATLEMTEGGGDQEVTVFISDVQAALGENVTEFPVAVNFTSTDSKMRRLYMTENIVGAGETPYILDLDGLDQKADGSIDIESDLGDGFEYAIPFPVFPSITEGTVEYKIWATTGRGDYRDTSDDLAVGVGTIVVIYSEDGNPATAVKDFDATIELAAPLADGTSFTFMSTLDGEVYKIIPESGLTDEELQEYVSFWDIGYYYGASGLASLASASDYPTGIVDIVTLAGLDDDSSLNDAYFSLSTTMTESDFDAITVSSELDFIEESSEQRINQLNEGDIVELVDNYGKKGLIKVVEIVGTDGSDGAITIEVKIQP